MRRWTHHDASIVLTLRQGGGDSVLVVEVNMVLEAGVGIRGIRCVVERKTDIVNEKAAGAAEVKMAGLSLQPHVAGLVFTVERLEIELDMVVLLAPNMYASLALRGVSMVAIDERMTKLMAVPSWLI